LAVDAGNCKTVLARPYNLFTNLSRPADNFFRSLGEDEAMKNNVCLLLLCAASVMAQEPIPNRLIDYREFQKVVADVGKEREFHRLTEAQFMEAMGEKGVVVLDARSAPRYALRHIRKAVSLPFTEFTAESLAKVIPDKGTKVLIYCNNNFENSPVAFPSKVASASLNLSTYTSLRSYGYTNVFELGPLLDVRTTAIPFAGSETK
jgi:hypothetical protein